MTGSEEDESDTIEYLARDVNIAFISLTVAMAVFLSFTFVFKIVDMIIHRAGDEKPGRETLTRALFAKWGGYFCNGLWAMSALGFVVALPIVRDILAKQANKQFPPSFFATATPSYGYVQALGISVVLFVLALSAFTMHFAWHDGAGRVAPCKCCAGSNRSDSKPVQEYA